MLSSLNLCVSIFIFTFSCRPLIPTAWGFFDIFCSSLQILRYASWPCLHSDWMPNNVLFKIGLLDNYNISIYDHVCEYICYFICFILITQIGLSTFVEMFYKSYSLWIILFQIVRYNSIGKSHIFIVQVIMKSWVKSTLEQC